MKSYDYCMELQFYKSPFWESAMQGHIFKVVTAVALLAPVAITVCIGVFARLAWFSILWKVILVEVLCLIGYFLTISKVEKLVSSMLDGRISVSLGEEQLVLERESLDKRHMYIDSVQWNSIKSVQCWLDGEFLNIHGDINRQNIVRGIEQRQSCIALTTCGTGKRIMLEIARFLQDKGVKVEYV